ncbi:hypothetical protein BDN70DRAFT_927549 [Pholiota conissans]|uniref:Uncharacterized protein n=1 Tax=Pholiota conissans TaxID=109636 RepID=A0A9P5ZBR1_9AGAR|nr:hypothetical protein BDN70DRAFT_927549 [Pholiota conissans]
MSYRKPVPVYMPSPTPSTQELPEVLAPPIQFEKNASADSPSQGARRVLELKHSAELYPPPLPQKLPEDAICLNLVEKDVPPLPRDDLGEKSINQPDSEVPSYQPALPPLPQDDTPEQTPSNEPEKDVPPLPKNWREILAEKASEEICSKKCLPSSEDLAKGDQLEFSQSISYEKISYRRQMNPSIKGYGYEGSYATLPGTQSSRGRGLPRDYRPPTPPLRSKSQRPEFSSQGVIAQSSFTHLDIYSNHSNRGVIHPSNSPLNARYHKQARSGGSIATNPSFQTEHTAISTNPSTMGWSRMKATPSNQTMYNNYRALVSQKQGGVNIVVQDPVSMASVHIIPSWKSGLKKWAKKVWRSMNLCK